MIEFSRYTRVKELVEQRTLHKNHWSAIEVEQMILEVLHQTAEEEIEMLEELKKHRDQPN